MEEKCYKKYMLTLGPTAQYKSQTTPWPPFLALDVVDRVQRVTLKEAMRGRDEPVPDDRTDRVRLSVVWCSPIMPSNEEKKKATISFQSPRPVHSV